VITTTISYDSTIATATGTVKPTIYTQGYLFMANTSTPGQVKITSITVQCNELHGSGSLFVVGFDIIGNNGDVSPLDFITGLNYTVIYDESDFSTPVDLGLQNGSLTIGLTFIRGDINGDGVVNSADAALALRIANGMITPTAEQEAACDVNGDGHCNSGDVVFIFCYANSQDWNACGGNQSMNRLLEANRLSSEPVELAFGPIQNQQPQTIVVPVVISNALDFTGGDFSFLYDASQMIATGAVTTSLTSGFLLEANSQPPGLLRVSLASLKPIAADGAIMELEFTVTNGISSINFGSIRLYDNTGRDFVTSALQRQIESVPYNPPSDSTLDGSITLQGRPTRCTLGGAATCESDGSR
jgi:hypothetical protein